VAFRPDPAQDSIIPGRDPMRVRSKYRAATTGATIRLDDDDAVVGFATSAAALADVWSSMVWLQTTSPTLNAVRREIARWARDADEGIAEMFGRRVSSDEIRVLIEEMPALIPRKVDAVDRAWLEASAAEAQRLTIEGRTAITRVTG
jgi:hypothetical protein